LQNELTSLRSAHHEPRARMETQIATAKAGKEVQEVELEQLRTTAAELRAGLDIREAENKDLRHRLEAAQAARTELEGVLGQRERELEDLNRQVAALQAELEAAHLNRRGLETTLSQRMTELAALHAQVERLQAAAVLPASPPAAMPAATATLALAEQAAAAPAAETPTVAEAEALAALAGEAPVVALDGTALKARILRASPEAGVTVREQAWPQDLEEVRGIGQAFAARLYSAGIGTFWELFHLSDAELFAILRLTGQQRRRLDPNAIRESALALAQATDTVGLVWSATRADDFIALPGLGKALARRLYQAGILTYEDLAHKTSEQLAAVLGIPPGGRLDYEALRAEALQRATVSSAKEV
jgi:predicted flap endonuclease-1-like 5' DNA nuclease